MKVNFTKRIQQKILYLVGPPETVTLENRIFNSMCLIAMVVSLVQAPFNYFTGLQMTGFIFGILLIALCGLYYLSRFRNRAALSIAITVVLVNLLFAWIYFVSSGISGASLMTFTLTFFLIMMVAPRGQYVIWLVFNLLLMAGIILTEYYHPELVPNMYPDHASKIVDLSATYLTSVLVIFFGTIYLKNAYNREKQQREEKTRVLEVLNTEKNKLFSIISHDLRSPMASIQSYLELMKDIQLPPEQKLQLEAELLQMVNNTQDMLYNILLWSKGQLQGLSVHLAPVNVHKAVMPVLDIHSTFITNKRLQLHTDIDKDLTAMADLNMLQLIIRNLVGNAIKFTPPGGQITLEAHRQDQQCQIVIRDTGTGIDPKRTPEIFSLKARSTFGTGNEKGIGLGLYLCSEYTAVQQGRIWFQNNPDKGCSFFLSFPLA
ncbi:sensor histidine kinase [Chitinophaga qingshengii]|uniref:histidine kinase n=1 Tax=Chitinophaga qingshengii TaxID=1569794 RepID=A0ABR7TGC3_9BACT|nr:HAMP domain-containing sensor histidine kinase [Chitinophaga qingshengii]MBC9929491.1 HAMP domain-containing histidine kinase [Chitinophaga qingshengii]